MFHHHKSLVRTHKIAPQQWPCSQVKVRLVGPPGAACVDSSCWDWHLTPALPRRCYPAPLRNPRSAAPDWLLKPSLTLTCSCWYLASRTQCPFSRMAGLLIPLRWSPNLHLDSTGGVGFVPARDAIVSTSMVSCVSVGHDELAFELFCQRQSCIHIPAMSTSSAD